MSGDAGIEGCPGRNRQPGRMTATAERMGVSGSGTGTPLGREVKLDMHGFPL